MVSASLSFAAHQRQLYTKSCLHQINGKIKYFYLQQMHLHCSIEPITQFPFYFGHLNFNQDTPRTKDSAKACTSGMFPVNYAGGGKYQIELHFNKRNKETKLLPGKCPRFDYFMLQYMRENRYKSIKKTNRKLIRYLEKHSGEKLPTFSKIWRLWDVLNVTRKRGKK